MRHLGVKPFNAPKALSSIDKWRVSHSGVLHEIAIAFLEGGV
jgi:hypothetical protein